MENFLSLGLPQPLLQSLTRMEFKTPTPIQAQSIPAALEGKDILGSAQTGTGKTAAFGIPLVTKLMNTPRGSALILTPTRELAVQVMDMLKQLIGRAPIGTALLIGGEAMPKQIQQLRGRPRLIVGTPGRINDHLGRGTLMLHDAGFLVLDETDRMLDMGFGPQLDKIFRYLPKVRQTLMFSATLPDHIVKLSAQFLNNPVRVSVGTVSKPIAKIQQEILHVSEEAKYGTLIEELGKRQGSVIVFVKTKWGADKMARRLFKDGHSADAIHGDLRQNRRDKVIQSFRDQKHRIMVATDIAARGLDIPHIEHVINYDLPQCPEDYIHRIGRTARAGAEGAAICFISPQDRLKWKAIHKLMNPGESLPQEAGERPSRGNAGRFRPHRGGSQRSSHEGGNHPAGNGGGRKPFRGFKPRRKPGGEQRKAA